MVLNFLPRRKPWLQDSCMWRMGGSGQEVLSWMDYIPGTYCRLFQDVVFRNLRHNSDYYMFLGCLRGYLEKELTDYLHKV